MRALATVFGLQERAETAASIDLRIDTSLPWFLLAFLTLPLKMAGFLLSFAEILLRRVSKSIVATNVVHTTAFGFALGLGVVDGGLPGRRLAVASALALGVELDVDVRKWSCR